jgi:signal transduction histidine kinase
MNDLAERLLDSIRVALAVVNDSGAITYRNAAFDRTFGESADYWIQNGARAVGGERGWIQGFFASSEQRAIDVELNDRIYHVERIDPGDADRQQISLAFEDVSAQRRAEQAKSDFTSMIVHDLRGPLSGIQGTLDFILSDPSTRMEPTHQELMVEATRESERLMNLINELLDFSKIESGNFTFEPEPVRLTGVLRTSLRSLQSVAVRDGIYLLPAHPPDLPPLLGSAEKLTQAVINLISNAVKFTPKGGLISVGAQVVRGDSGPEAVLVTVTDTGVGIKLDQQANLFQKYKQTSSKSFRGGGGTGLGLFIVKQIVEAHGGSVDIASLEGIGTSMVMRFPVRRVS